MKLTNSRNEHCKLVDRDGRQGGVERDDRWGLDVHPAHVAACDLERAFLGRAEKEARLLSIDLTHAVETRTAGNDHTQPAASGVYPALLRVDADGEIEVRDLVGLSFATTPSATKWLISRLGSGENPAR